VSTKNLQAWIFAVVKMVIAPTPPLAQCYTVTMKVNKEKFDALLARLIKAEPQKRSETKPDKKKRRPKRAG
jgi:hypothetical protein